MNNSGGKLHFATSIDNSQMRTNAEESKRILQSISGKATQEGGKMDRAFSSLGKTIAGAFSVAAATSFARKIVEVRSEMESLQKSFEVLAGTNAGGKLFGDIKDFAVKTPLMLQDLAKGAQTMLAFNIEAEKVMPLLKAIGDISMGDAGKLNSLTLAFSQMSATGRLMGQDLLQMINAGFNPLAVISQQTGKSIGELKEEMEKGKISTEMVTKAFMDATSAGGKFHGMLESMSQTTKGAISNLKGAWEDMLNAIGEQSQGVLTGAIGVATDLVKDYEGMGRIIVELIATFGVYKAALLTLSTIEKLRYQAHLAQMAGMTKMQVVTDILKNKTAALNAVMAKNPYVLVAAAVAALAFGIYKLATATTDAEKAQKKLDAAHKDYQRSVGAEIAQMDTMFARLKAAKEGTKEYQSAKDAILAKYGSYLESQSKEIQSLQDIKGAYDAIKTAAEEAAKAQAMSNFMGEAASDYSDKLTSAKEDMYDALKKQYGGKKGADGIDLAETYYWKIVPVLEGSERMTEELEAILKPMDKEHRLGGVEWTTNAGKEAIQDALKARKIFGDITEEAKRLFGEAPSAAGSPDESTKSDPVKNKKYWEDRQKEMQTELDAMTEIELKSDEAVELRKKIAEAQAKIDAYSVKRGGASTNSGTNSQAQETASRNSDIKRLEQQQIKEAKEATFALRQAEIDADNDGFIKAMKQNQLNYDKLMEANLQRREEWVERLRDLKEEEWQNENPDYKKKGLVFDREAITNQDLSADQIEALKKYEQIATEIKTNTDKQTLQTLLSEYQGYTEARKKIEDDFAKDKAALYEEDGKTLKQGVTQDNVDELEYKREEALAAVDEQFATREATYQEWCNIIASQTLSNIQAVLEQAKAELAKLEQDPNADPNELAEARAKVNTAEKAVSQKKAEEATSPGKRTLEEWKDLYDVLNDCKGAFDDIGDAVGGVAGEIISTAGDMLTSAISMINGIVQLANWSAISMKMTAEGASSAIQAVEKASVILTIISTALQVTMAIVNLVKSNAQKEAQKKMEDLQARVDALEKSYDKLGRAIEEAYSKDASKLIEQSNELLRKQKEAIMEQKRLEEDKKKKDEKAIRELQDKYDELDERMSENQQKAVDAIFGNDVRAAIEDFAEAYADAWGEGESRAKSTKETVRKMMQEMVNESVKAAIKASGAMDQIRSKLQQFYADGVLSDWEQQYVYNMGEELQRQINEQFGWADSLMKGLTDREGSSKGITSASQSTVDELNGRATAIQGHTFSIAESTRNLVSVTSSILSSVLRIEDHTEKISDRMDAVEAAVKETRSTVSDIYLKGVKMK